MSSHVSTNLIRNALSIRLGHNLVYALVLRFFKNLFKEKSSYVWSSAQTVSLRLVHSHRTSTVRLPRRNHFEFGALLTKGGSGHGSDTSDNSGFVAPGGGAQMAPQQKLGIRTERRYCGTSRNRVDSLDAWSVLGSTSCNQRRFQTLAQTSEELVESATGC